MAASAGSFDKAALDALFADAEPPSDDDVSVMMDGRRLDTREAVIAFFQEHAAERAAEADQP